MFVSVLEPLLFELMLFVCVFEPLLFVSVFEPLLFELMLVNKDMP